MTALADDRGCCVHQLCAAEDSGSEPGRLSADREGRNDVDAVGLGRKADTTAGCGRATSGARRHIRAAAGADEHALSPAQATAPSAPRRCQTRRAMFRRLRHVRIRPQSPLLVPRSSFKQVTP
jgi:hypothetical protein